ncbi:hypothetical protein, partial [Chryseobacterium contaminans]|uniref:hypothetical protein n=1 Tax=Chryseobacterium contaminans TaxID=1423959 RepID=UPI001E2B75B1
VPYDEESKQQGFTCSLFALKGKDVSDALEVPENGHCDSHWSPGVAEQVMCEGASVRSSCKWPSATFSTRLPTKCKEDGILHGILYKIFERIRTGTSVSTEVTH